MESVKLFPKIIGIFKNPNMSSHQKIVKKCYSIKKKIPSGGDNWLSKVYNVNGKLNLYKEKDFKPLNKYAWFQIYKSGDYQDYHIHPTSKLSAIYFLKGKKNSAPVLFTDFNFNMNHFNLITPTEDNSLEWNIPFQEGVLLIFRSEIQHCVPKNNTTERISIAVNYEYI